MGQTGPDTVHLPHLQTMSYSDQRHQHWFNRAVIFLTYNIRVGSFNSIINMTYCEFGTGRLCIEYINIGQYFIVKVICNKRRCVFNTSYALSHLLGDAVRSSARSLSCSCVQWCGFTCVLVVSWITAFLKFSLESVVPIAIISFNTNGTTATENPC